MIRLVLALLALLSPAALMVDDAGPRHRHPTHAEEGWVPLDLTLPASSAWVAIPVTAVQDATIDIRVRGPGVEPGEARHAMILLAPIEDDERFTGFGASTGSASSMIFQANLDGERVGCCDQLSLVGPMLGASSGSGESEIGDMTLQRGQTAWITLIVANADLAQPASGELLVESGQVSIGERRSGEDVSYVDLVDDAYQQGTNVKLLDMTIGSSGKSTQAWEPVQNGLMFLHWWAHGSASATLSARASGESVLENVRTMADEPGMVFAMGAGDYGVELRDLKEGGGLPFGPDSSRLTVTALFADLDVPGFGRMVHPQPEHGEHAHHP